MRLLVTAPLLALLIAGCATQAPTGAQLKAAPSSQLYKQPTVTATDPARITVIRDVGLLAGGVFIHISLDGERLASLDPGQYFTLVVDPGEYQFGAVPTDAFGGRKITAIDVAWKAGQKAVYRVGVDGNLAVIFARDPGATAPP